MRHLCPKCKKELRWEKTMDNMIQLPKEPITYQRLDLYYCLHCRKGYTKILYEYKIKGELK